MASVFGAAGSKALDTSQGPKAPPPETWSVQPVKPAIPSDDPMAQDPNASWTARPDLAAEYPLMDRFGLEMYQHKETGEIAAFKWVENLLTLVNTTGRMPEDQARVLITQMASALYCHEQRVVNRDLRLENLVVDKNGVPKLCDFNCSQYYVKAPVHTKVGSPVYMAPEMLARPATIGKPSIWSHWRSKLLVLGMLLFSTVTGARLYQDKAQSLDDLLHDVRNSIWHRPIAVTLSQELDDLLHKLLALEPEKCLQSMEEVLRHPWFNKPGVHGAHAGSEPWQRTYGPTIHPDTTVHFADLTPGEGARAMQEATEVYMADDIFFEGVDVLLASKACVSSVSGSLW